MKVLAMLRASGVREAVRAIYCRAELMRLPFTGLHDMLLELSKDESLGTLFQADYAQEGQLLRVTILCGHRSMVP